MTDPGRPLSRRERRELERQAAGGAPVEETPVSSAPRDGAMLSRKERRMLERAETPMMTWTAEEEAEATGQMPPLTPEAIAEQERIEQEKAARAMEEAQRHVSELERPVEAPVRRSPFAPPAADESQVQSPPSPQSPAEQASGQWPAPAVAHADESSASEWSEEFAQAAQAPAAPGPLDEFAALAGGDSQKPDRARQAPRQDADEPEAPVSSEPAQHEPELPTWQPEPVASAGEEFPVDFDSMLAADQEDARSRWHHPEDDHDQQDHAWATEGPEHATAQAPAVAHGAVDDAAATEGDVTEAQFAEVARDMGLPPGMTMEQALAMFPPGSLQRTLFEERIQAATVAPTAQPAVAEPVEAPEPAPHTGERSSLFPEAGLGATVPAPAPESAPVPAQDLGQDDDTPVDEWPPITDDTPDAPPQAPAFHPFAPVSVEQPEAAEPQRSPIPPQGQWDFSSTTPTARAWTQAAAHSTPEPQVEQQDAPTPVVVPEAAASSIPALAPSDDDAAAAPAIPPGLVGFQPVDPPAQAPQDEAAQQESAPARPSAFATAGRDDLPTGDDDLPMPQFTALRTMTSTAQGGLRPITEPIDTGAIKLPTKEELAQTKQSNGHPWLYTLMIAGALAVTGLIIFLLWQG